MKDTFIVKQESIVKFLNLEKNRQADPFHYLFKDELIIPKREELKDKLFIQFEVEDHTNESILTNTYKYQKEYYDDVSLKLVLVDFKVTVKEIKRKLK